MSMLEFVKFGNRQENKNKKYIMGYLKGIFFDLTNSAFDKFRV